MLIKCDISAIWWYSVTPGEWTQGTDGSSQGADILNSGRSTIKIGDTSLEDNTSTQIEAANDAQAQTKVGKAISLAIDRGTSVKSGSYTKSLNWNLTTNVNETTN